MPNRPIILTPWQVRAVQEGRLKQIRVPVKLDIPDNWNLEDFSFDPELLAHDEDGEEKLFTMKGLIATFEHNEYGEMYRNIRSPFCPGDTLYVRETWCNINKPECPPDYYYLTDCLDSAVEDYDPGEWTWRSPATMPRAAARLFLPVGEVRVQRASEATEEDAIAEGVSKSTVYFRGEPHKIKGTPKAYNTAREARIGLWDYHYASKYPWAEGLWTFVGTIKVKEGSPS